MNRISRILGLVIVATMIPGIAAAQKSNIYSWTDENGVKHYSDRAPAEVVADKKEIPESYETIPINTVTHTPTDQAADPDESDPDAADPDSTPDELSYADRKRLEIEEKRKAQSEAQTERQRICLEAKDQLARIEPNRRVYYTDEDGNTTRMDDEERVRRVEDNKKIIAEYCD